MRSLVSAIALLAAAPAAAQSYPPAPPIGSPKPFNVPASETYRLPNGMAVTLVPYGAVPKAVMMLDVYAGGVNEAEKVWLSQLAAEMTKQGAAGKSAGQLATAAADMGGNLNVVPGEEKTSFGIDVLSEHVGDAVALLGDVATKPDFPASEFDRVKAAAARRLAIAMSQPGTLATAALFKRYYGAEHPYGRYVPTQAQLTGYTLDETKAFFAGNFGAKRAHLYIAGRFDTAAAKAAIQRAFGGWAPGPERVKVPYTPAPGPVVLMIDRPGAPQSTLRLAFPAPAGASAGDVPERVSNALLGGAFSSRITRNIREDKGYTYSPGSSIQFWPGAGTWVFQADVTSAATGASLTEVFKEIRGLQQTTPPAEEVAGSRNYLAGLFSIQNATAQSLINSMAQRDGLGWPADWLQTYVPAVLAVTPSQVQAAAVATQPIDKATLVVVGDLASVEPQLKALPELKGVTFQRVTVP
ncbi:pitrilysin family protein [Sphingomonas sp. Y38-1Y]|uniref:M16 family metallopeptidase n=1 Tax=Sphingomonas sp. Y38-1Y TaxID=3078265 RepID=UPI0028EB6AEB|nr:pitrilysin family protein [Sphingomonas sp. Y38-1Y]